MAWALTADYDGLMSAKNQFYLGLAASALLALAAVIDAVRSEWWAAGLLGTAAVVSLIVAFRQRKMTNA
jgi:hypothetical protein